MDAEAYARVVLERHGWDLGDAPGARRLVQAELGADGLRQVPPSALRGAEGELAVVGGRPVAFVSSRLGAARRAFVALHELGHHVAGAREHGDPELEAFCDAFAAALLCPRTAFRAAVCRHGLDWQRIAADFGTSCTVAALRYGEVIGDPLALVAPRTVRVRGAAWTWPDERGLRRLARTGGPGLARAVLPDDARRVVLVAEAVA